MQQERLSWLRIVSFETVDDICTCTDEGTGISSGDEKVGIYRQVQRLLLLRFW